jgi:S1-C subfamily serine protease
MNVLDWCLLALVGIYALSGYWQGFITGASATAGLLLGGLAGIWVAPLALGDAAPSLWVSLGVAVSGTRIGAVTPLVRDSTILAKVDRTLPADSDKVLQTFNNVVGTTFFPRYLEPFAPERIVAVGPGDPRMLTDPDVLAAETSVVKVRGTNGCGGGVEGTGFFYAPGRLMTNAHVVAGVTRPEVEVGGSTLTASVVFYDPQLDIAVLSLPDTGSLPLGFDTEVVPRDPVAVLGYPEDGPYDVESGRIRSEQRLRSPDIYGDGTVIRQVFSLRGLIRPGNSGGPIVTSGGDVAGMVFAASVSDPETGYALTADQLAESAAEGVTATSPVDTGTCVR